MIQQTPVVFVWEDWDWRPLARLVVWILLAAAWAYWRHAVSFASLGQAFRESLVGALFTFGLLTYVQALVAAAALRLVMELDEAAFAVAERLMRPFTGRAPFAAGFAAAFGAELFLIFGSVQIWHAMDVGARVGSLLAAVLR